MRKFLTYLVVVPLAVLFVLFAIANREIVTISFDPFSATQPALSFTMPLFVLIIILLIIGILVGSLVTWIGQGRYRREARILNGDIHVLRREMENLNTRLAATPSSSSETTRISYSPPTL